MTTTARPTCTATRRDGTPCTAPARASGLCFAHDPALAGQRQAAYVQGGRNKAAAVRADKLVPSRLRPTLDKLIRALDEVHSGTLDARRAQAMAGLASAIVRCFEAGEAEDRLRALETGGGTDEYVS